MFASGIAYFISRVDQSSQRNVIDWVIFFGSYKNYSNLEDVCDAYCIVCILLWLTLFAAGCFVQYRLHNKHKKKDHDDRYQTDSESDSEESGSSRKVRKKKKRRDSSSEESSSDSDSSQKRKKKKKQRPNYDEPVGPEYAGSQYGGSVRVSRYGGASIHSHSHDMPGSARRPPPSVAMSAYGANYYHGNRQQVSPGVAPGVAHSAQYGNYGQRNAVQYV